MTNSENHKLLLEISKFDIKKLSEVLSLNGASDCCDALVSQQIDGEAFLNLSECQLRLWRNLNKTQVTRLWSLLQLAKERPKMFYNPADHIQLVQPPTNPIRPRKPISTGKQSEQKTYIPGPQLTSPQIARQPITIKPPENNVGLPYDKVSRDWNKIFSKGRKQSEEKPIKTLAMLPSNQRPFNEVSLPKPPVLPFIPSIPDDEDPPSSVKASPSSKAYVPRNDYTKEAWYKPVNRKGVQGLLENKPDGTFLVRPSSQEQNVCTLSIVYNKKIYNLAISECRPGALTIGNTSERVFSSVKQIIDFYIQNQLPLKYDNADVHVQLYHL